MALSLLSTVVSLSLCETFATPADNAVVGTESFWPCKWSLYRCPSAFLRLSLSLQPSLLRAIFNVDPDEVRSLIFKKEDVNVQVGHSLAIFSPIVEAFLLRPQPCLFASHPLRRTHKQTMMDRKTSKGSSSKPAGHN